MKHNKQFLAISALMVLASCSREGEWQGWIYPDRADLTEHIRLGQFATFESCQQTALRVTRLISTHEAELMQLDEEHDERTPDYECGYRCEVTAYGLSLCEETRK